MADKVFFAGQTNLPKKPQPKTEDWQRHSHDTSVIQLLKGSISILTEALVLNLLRNYAVFTVQTLVTFEDTYCAQVIAFLIVNCVRVYSSSWWDEWLNHFSNAVLEIEKVLVRIWTLMARFGAMKHENRWFDKEDPVLSRRLDIWYLDNNKAGIGCFWHRIGHEMPMRQTLRASCNKHLTCSRWYFICFVEAKNNIFLFLSNPHQRGAEYHFYFFKGSERVMDCRIDMTPN